MPDPTAGDLLQQALTRLGIRATLGGTIACRYLCITTPALGEIWLSEHCGGIDHAPQDHTRWSACYYPAPDTHPDTYIDIPYTPHPTPTRDAAAVAEATRAFLAALTQPHSPPRLPTDRDGRP